MTFRFSTLSSLFVSTMNGETEGAASWLRAGGFGAGAVSGSSSGVSVEGGPGQHLNWSMRSFGSHGSVEGVDSEPVRATIIGGDLSDVTLHDVLDATVAPEAFVFGTREGTVVSATSEPDIFVYDAGIGDRTILGFDMSEDQLILLGVAGASLVVEGAHPTAVVRLDDGSSITLHLAAPEVSADPFALG
jgi:hypothetical protein